MKKREMIKMNNGLKAYFKESLRELKALLFTVKHRLNNRNMLNKGKESKK